MTRRHSLFLGIGSHVLLIAIAIWLFGGGCQSTVNLDRTSSSLPHDLHRLRDIHQPLGPPLPGDWLTSHAESGQTFEEWRDASPITPTGKRTSLYIQPIGAFSAAERRIVELTAEFMAIYFQRPVRFLPDLADDCIPASARRLHPNWGTPQILSTYVLHEVLQPELPADAAALIAFTASDLWPGRGWNFVFGQASLRDRVGVWSIHRNGDPTQSGEAFALCLLRTCKTATHETGHMFSMAHCTAYECNMCGCNNRAESDRRPLASCPECVAKICAATGADPMQRFEQLVAFCQQHGLRRAQRLYETSLASLRGK